MMTETRSAGPDRLLLVIVGLLMLLVSVLVLALVPGEDTASARLARTGGSPAAPWTSSSRVRGSWEVTSPSSCMPTVTGSSMPYVIV